MKKIFLVFVAACFLMVYKTSAQCSVNISTTANSTQLNCTITTLKLSAVTGGTSGAVTFTWSNGATTNSIDVTDSAKYTVVIKDTTGCISSSSVRITKDNSAPVVKILPFPNTICNGESATLVALGAVSYSWQPGLQTINPITVNPTRTTKYSVTGTASNGCTGKDSFTLMVNPLPTASLSGTTSVCQNSAEPAVVFKGLSGTRPFTFGFNINGGSRQIVTTTGRSDSVIVKASTQILGTYNYNLISVTDSNGCTNAQTGTATITINEGPVLSTLKDTSICTGNIFNYTATSSVTGTNFTWRRLAVSGISNPAVSRNAANINEMLIDTTDAAVLVPYIYTLTSGNGASCVSTDTLKLIVNPTPVIDTIIPKSFCNGEFVNGGIQFSSKSTGAGFSWTNNNPAIGLGSSGSGNILPFNAQNNTATPITATINVFVKASADSCPGASKSFTITVLPAPILTSIKNTSVCDNSVFQYIATSSANGTNFTWKRTDREAGIENVADSGLSDTITETLHNNTSQPVLVKYRYELSTGTGCITSDSVMVTVNPTPVIDSIIPKSYCNGEYVSGGIPFTSKSPGAVFTWTNSNTAIGLSAADSGSILPFNARNTTANPITATITVFLKASADNCIGTSKTFTITVLPAPVLTSVKDTSVCNNTVFSYTATSSAGGTSFKWTRADNANSGTSATIAETLNNNSAQPVVVKYMFTLSTGSGCETMDSLLVTVNPTPVIDPIADKSYCNNLLIQPVPIQSPTTSASFNWSANPSIGFGTVGTGNIPAFITNNQSDSTIVANVSVRISVGNNCFGDSVAFKMTVYPTATLNSKKDTSVCDNAAFIYTATSTVAATSFSWIRPFVIGINNALDSVQTNGISEKLNNLTSQPVNVYYRFKLTVGSNCITTDSIKVVVNPTPVINKITAPPPFCNGNRVLPISFTSNSPNPAFTWSSDTTIGFGLTGSDSIPSFIASNTGVRPINATVTVKITASSNRCPGPDSSFIITVNPSPQKPLFTSLSRFPDNEVLTLCSGTENINFNANSPDTSISYVWTSTPANSPLAVIKNTNQPNTAISFRNTGLARVSINLLATDTLSCSNIVSQIVQLGPTAGITERKIFLKQPGNLLVYPDNSLDLLKGYQWGYDSLLRANASTLYSPPIPIAGQVYQTFIPEGRFIINNQLDTVSRAFWVSLQQGSCYSRVYYNGPYSRQRIAVIPPPDNTVELKIIPNPSNGNFQIHLQGNIYGSIYAKIYNAVGQVVLDKVFTKNTTEVYEKINALHFPKGIYFLVLNSSDLKKVVSRFIIQH